MLESDALHGVWATDCQGQYERLDVVPTNLEWTALVNYLGGYDHAGSKLKEVGNTHWQDTNDPIVSKATCGR